MLSYLQAIPVSEQLIPTWWFFPSRKKKHKKEAYIEENNHIFLVGTAIIEGAIRMESVDSLKSTYQE